MIRLMQIEKNYKMFKEALNIICRKIELSEEDQNYLYLKAKAELYNIDWDYSIYDPIGLEQTIDEYESLERKYMLQQKGDYYKNIEIKNE